MSLYYEAATVLANPEKEGGSLKSRIYRKKDLKSTPSQLYALVIEASKWSVALKDVIERSEVLKLERKLTPILALLLTHDLLLSKSGVAAPANHVLKLAITRHKARLSAEFTKARIRGGFSTLEALRDVIEDGKFGSQNEGAQNIHRHPRWIRVNTLKSTLEEQLDTTLAGYERAGSLAEVLSASGRAKVYYIDEHIPGLLALPPKADLSKSSAYAQGRIIFQDKASCFPAYLLDVQPDDGNIVDGCAAPGNKTTHLAAIGSSHEEGQRVIAFEKDKGRAKILTKMVDVAGAADIVSVRAGQDFLASKPDSEEFAKVGALLLDPSCSGSGIVGRDDTLHMHLPDSSASAPANAATGKNKKRKREQTKSDEVSALQVDLEELAPEETPEEGNLEERLTALSTFQLRILTHAMKFPNATKITYSTCSVHFQENEGVVMQALAAPIAKERGWSILKREQQVDGLRKWHNRGALSLESVTADGAQDVLDACIRCEKGTEDGTMGFFVAAFVRNPSSNDYINATGVADEIIAEEDDEWNGFSDEEHSLPQKSTRAAAPLNQTARDSKDKKKKRKKN